MVGASGAAQKLAASRDRAPMPAAPPRSSSPSSYRVASSTSLFDEVIQADTDAWRSSPCYR